MDVINIGRSRRFLKERPIRVTLFDRPRLVCDLICLEAGQSEKRRGLDTSDSLYLVVEGKARLTSGAQVEELQEQDAALLPPGVDHSIENIGPERLAVIAMVTPKPTRASEVRMPGARQPRGRTAFRGEDAGPREGQEMPSAPDVSSEQPRGEYGDRRPPRPYSPRPPRAGDRPYAPRSPRSGGDRPYAPSGPRAAGDRPYTPRGRQSYGDAGPRPARGRPEGSPRQQQGEGPVWYPRPKAPYRPRGTAPPGRPTGGRPSYPGGASGAPLPRGREQGDERESLPDERPKRSRFTGPPGPGDPRPAPRGRTAGRPPARGGTARGAPRRSTNGPEGGGARPRSGSDRPTGAAPRGGIASRGSAGGDARPRGRGAAKGAGSPRPAPRGSRPSAPRGQGRSGPKTSGRRPTP